MVMLYFTSSASNKLPTNQMTHNEDTIVFF
nr:MAG TPA: hypothetical protein [Caudoviricetes sp.]